MTSEIDEQLIAAYRAGSEEAASKLFERYYHRLLRFVALSRNAELRQVEGDSDVVQSVFDTLFRQGKAGEITLPEQGTLWPLLVTIALNRVRNQGKFWTRQKRDIAKNVPLEAAEGPLVRDPTPEEIAAVREATERLLGAFPERRRRILELLLEGHSIDEVTDAVGTSRVTIYKTRLAAAELLAASLRSSPAE